ncbi:MAG: CDP-alcohol phosphatidyltransferase family protein [Chloroflexi bacterium]|nr:CDP-alcohol phosphatidyltransferase family protein [Chloroflexota bacterium]
MLTLAGALLCAGAGALAAMGLLAAAGWLSLLGSGLDMLDGALARATNQATRFGALLDSTLDRYGEAFLLGGVFLSASGQGAVEEQTLVLLALLGSLMVSYVKARAEGLGYSCDVGLLTRPERVVVLGVGLITGLVVPALAIVAVLANLTAVQRLLHVWHEARREEDGNRQA